MSWRANRNMSLFSFLNTFFSTTFRVLAALIRSFKSSMCLILAHRCISSFDDDDDDSDDDDDVDDVDDDDVVVVYVDADGDKGEQCSSLFKDDLGGVEGAAAARMMRSASALMSSVLVDIMLVKDVLSMSLLSLLLQLLLLLLLLLLLSKQLSFVPTVVGVDTVPPPPTPRP